MCDHEDSPRAPLTFAEFASLLQQPPFEPCDSELKHLTRAEYIAAFDEVWNLYFRPISYHIASITRDYDNAADLAQEVFANVYKARASFEKAYIYRAAKNAAYNALRQTRRRRILETRWAGVRGPYEGGKFDAPDARLSQDAELFERAREEALGRAVERLPEKFRVPLMLFAEGKSYRQITEITEANVGTVKSRICRGKSILRRRLRAYL